MRFPDTDPLPLCRAMAQAPALAALRRVKIDTPSANARLHAACRAALLESPHLQGVSIDAHLYVTVPGWRMERLPGFLARL